LLAKELDGVGSRACDGQFIIKNTTAGILTVAPTAGNFTPFVPPGTGNCRYTNLGAGAS